MLTAAHVVDGVEALRVRFRADQPGAWTGDGVVIWRDSRIDVAIAAIAEDSHSADQLPPVRFARVKDDDGGMPCTALGFPRYKLRDDQGSAYRDYAHVIGTAMPWSNLREGTLSISVPAPAGEPACGVATTVSA